MQTEIVQISQLTMAEYNPREISKEDFASLKKSIKTFGFVEPVVINKDNTIIGGHMRTRAALDLGFTEVPCIRLDITKEQEKALNLALNRISGAWDKDKLTELIYDLSKREEINYTGFTQKEIAHMIGKVAGENVEPEVPFTEELLEEHNYVVLYFDNSVDWLQAQTLFDLQPVQALHSQPGFQAKGTGRVLNGAKALERLRRELH